MGSLTFSVYLNLYLNRRMTERKPWHDMWCLQFHLKIAKFWRIYYILYRTKLKRHTKCCIHLQRQIDWSVIVAHYPLQSVCKCVYWAWVLMVMYQSFNQYGSDTRMHWYKIIVWLSGFKIDLMCGALTNLATVYKFHNKLWPLSELKNHTPTPKIKHKCTSISVWKKNERKFNTITWSNGLIIF